MRDAAPDRAALTRRDLLIGGACCGGALLGASAPIWSAPRPLPAGGLGALVPRRIGAWRVSGTQGVVIAQDGDRARGPYDDLLTRIYEAPASPPVTLLVAYIGSQRADVRLHRPEACYPAAGFTLRDPAVIRLALPGLPVIRARMIRAESTRRTEQMLYWTRVGTRFPTSNVEQLEAFVLANLSGRVPDAVLVRLSVPGRDRAAGQAAITAFLAELHAASSPAGAQILFGGHGLPGHADPSPSDRNGAST